MKSLLILEHLRVENANAISGMTWGFPAVTNFLGFTHALSRFTQKEHGVALGGCGVICHWHQVKAHQPGGYGEYVFGLTRNPLIMKGKEAVTAPFNEEGKMHLEVSLLIECDFDFYDLPAETGNDEEDIELFTQAIKEKLLTLRLAGGNIQSVQQVRFETLPETSEEQRGWARKKLLKLLPGFALVDRSELLTEHFQELQKRKQDAELLDAWLDFAALKYQAQPDPEIEDLNEETPATWELQPKPAEGWLVPIMTGYQGISPLYEPGEVAHTRDPSVPFRFVESVYGIGQWLSPHRIKKLDQLIWHYQQQGTDYLCTNSYQPETE